MRITSSMYYDNLYGSNNSKLSQSLFDVNKQIASGLKIQYAKDDVRAFAETMSLDNELSTLAQIKKSTESGYKVSNQTDVVLNEFGTTMERMRTLLVQAAGGSHSDTSLDAIANELRIVEDHMKNMANTSINGQYLFSGTAVDIKPISDDGTYNGNDGSLSSFLGSKSQQAYNISGDKLFFGEEVLTKRKITTNVIQSDLSQKYNFASGADNDTLPKPITTENTIRDLMGDTDSAVDTVTNKHHFYLRGTTSDGTAIKKQISMKDDDKVEELLNQIGDAFGNTPNLDIVNVSINKSGQIEIEDKIKGSSKLDFHLIGAIDFDTTGADAADVTNLDLLDSGENEFSDIMLTLAGGGTPGLYVKEFIKSGLTSATGAATNIEGIVYDRTQFSKDGSTLSSSAPQILKDYNTSTTPPTKLVENAFATNSTKLSDVADLSQGTADTLDGTQIKLTGTNVLGVAYDVQIDLATAGSTFSLDGGITNYDIFNMESSRVAVDADKMTYQQLMDVVNMVVTDNIPTLNTEVDYDAKIKASDFNGETFLSHDGKIQFQEIGSNDTNVSISLYDANSDDFSVGASVMTFNSNNAITIVDPKTDFFKEIDEMITAVEDHKVYPDSSSGTVRNLGIENAIAKIDALQDHIIRSHSLVGAQSNALTMAKERTELLEIGTMTLRSSVIDTDLAESSLKLTQLTINYESMLSTVGKVSKLSLVNYLYYLLLDPFVAYCQKNSLLEHFWLYFIYKTIIYILKAT
ncbi:MAG: flagellar biosynthesis protein FlgL [Sulfurimonas sp.]|jgi:flagellar hook-associated protein 3 FlgL|nr:flagellar biosynthesis protein FlgL [Sulfurimonas sp.]